MHPPTLGSSLRAFLAAPALSKQPRVLVVACSGGADSVALLKVAAEVAPKLGWRVEALHCEHGIRREAKRDAAFVTALCGKLGLPLHGFEARIPKGPGLEARARAWRQACYANAAKKAGARLVLLAHHAQDQAETLLLNLLRGAGPKGAAGMRPLSPLQGAPRIRLGRPFLGQTPQRLRAWLKRERQAWREDASNRDQSFARNRLRHTVLPALAQINAKAVEHLAAFAEAQGSVPAGSDLAGLLKLGRAARARALTVLAGGAGQADLGRGWTLSVSAGRVLVSTAAAAPIPSALPLSPGPWQTWGRNWRFQLKLGLPTARNIKASNAFWFPLGILEAGLSIRAVQAGDRIEAFGPQKGSKLVFDCLAEAKVPAWDRTQWPVLVQGSRILGLPGVRRSRHEAVAVGRKALVLQWRCASGA